MASSRSLSCTASTRLPREPRSSSARSSSNFSSLPATMTSTSPTVGVSNPTLQPPSPCLAVNKPTEADPLHTTLDDVVAHHNVCSSPYARDRYAPSAVSTRIFSPSLMNGGTWTTRPVSILAGLVTEEAVADFRPGSVSTTVISTVCGNSMPTASPSKNETLICRLGMRYSIASPSVRPSDGSVRSSRCS